ncbi:MAG: phasin family protein [Polaromonas sp.]|uniref:phasin family protein n=1 Tax=Polaromonas sp. TaxID=1869339 RepID=UPI0024874173|nr:phasin family protein [Polaromonas sp.]MDI1239773.1 phasin family protein [Polaromonas sp.]
MRAKPSLPASPRKSTETDTTPARFLADLGRQQLAVATDAACALLRGSEAMRAIQHQAAHEASLRHQAAAQKLHDHCEPADLLAIQSDLLRFDLLGATQYWQQITATALQSQVEMMANATHLLDNEQGGALKSAMESFQAAIASGNGFFAGKPTATAPPTRT